ncbi:ABC transporter permease [Pseudoruegeria sp. SHC-113]|uniref:ABC transporter permease n=1 Tax=Pseudoruegeria sp. SHC-113 TaxID=2855439 RepID=UPI0021BB6B5F|nr:ABC transporter permease [Pseudoruegeria sp. SHC-113]MCT8162170.1 ABC transporter permease [Pseudoruegeria sp. SHC-113]
MSEAAAMTPPVTEAASALPDRPSASLYMRALLRDPVTLAALLFVLLLILCAVMPGVLAPYDPTAQSLRMRNSPPLAWPADGPVYLLGSDALGRDILSRIIYSARVSLLVAVCGVAVSGAIGIAAGVTAGTLRGRTDDVIMRLADLQLGFPFLMLALLVLYALGPSLANIILIFAIVRWPVYARVSRGLAMSLREAPYVEAARALGASNSWIIRRHILPNMSSPLIVLATMEVAKLILAEATLSFLGLGIQPPESSWGLMVAAGRDYVSLAWWLVAFPGMAIFLTALSANLLAAWLRAVSDPVQRWRWLLPRKPAQSDTNARKART